MAKVSVVTVRPSVNVVLTGEEASLLVSLLQTERYPKDAKQRETLDGICAELYDAGLENDAEYTPVRS